MSSQQIPESKAHSVSHSHREISEQSRDENNLRTNQKIEATDSSSESDEVVNSKEQRKGDTSTKQGHEENQQQQQQQELQSQQQQQQKQFEEDQNSNSKLKRQNQDSYSFHNNNPNHVITNEMNDIEWECIDCNKKYKSYPAFYTHNKIKHQGNPPEKYKIPRPLDSISKDRGRPKADQSNKQKFTDKDQRQHNMEDQIYEFLAKAGANVKKFSLFLQNNYWINKDDQDNKIIRQYLNDPVDYLAQMPNFTTDDSFFKSCYQCIREEISKLVELVRQYEDYQYMDPMELSDPIEQEVNLFNLKYLLLHYKTSSLVNQYTLISIFIAWIGKELRAESYKELSYSALSYYIASLKDAHKTNQTGNCIQQLQSLKEALERQKKSGEYLQLLEGVQLKLFPKDSLFLDLIDLIKNWMMWWIDFLCESDNDNFSQLNEKKEEEQYTQKLPKIMNEGEDQLDDVEDDDDSDD